MAAAGGSGVVPPTEASKASLVELDKNMHESLQASLKLVLEVSQEKTLSPSTVKEVSGTELFIKS